MKHILLSLLLLSAIASSHDHDQHHFAGGDISPTGLDAYVHNATSNLIFTSIASLLQQWPNTRYRNGHTIVKGTIPKGTTLYHGRGDSNVPVVPEWTAFNLEHSYLVCAAAQPPECWMLTLMVEKQLNVVYFDGSSAANSYLGHQDSQDLVIWGQVRRDKMMAEWERLDELCKWGKQFDLDAIARMEPGFEVMLCDFAKLKLVSSIRIMDAPHRSPPLQSTSLGTMGQRRLLRLQQAPPNPQAHLAEDLLPTSSSTLPPRWQGPLRDTHSVSLETAQAAAWNSFYPGEVRVKLDYSRLISFYDPVYTSLVAARAGISRQRHRFFDISTEDLQLALTHLHADFTRAEDTIPEIDWAAVMRAVTDRYADRLQLLQNVLGASKVSTRNATAISFAVRRHLMVMLTPYLVYEALPDPSSELPSSGNTSWVAPIAFHCETVLTSAILDGSLTRSERLIKRGVEGVLHRICSSLTNIWADAYGVVNASEDRAVDLVAAWRTELKDLVQWLDWPMWDTCRPACPDEMFCYISMWPWGFSWTEEDPDTIDMTPRCLDREAGELGPGRSVE